MVTAPRYITAYKLNQNIFYYETATSMLGKVKKFHVSIAITLAAVH